MLAHLKSLFVKLNKTDSRLVSIIDDGDDDDCDDVGEEDNDE